MRFFQSAKVFFFNFIAFLAKKYAQIKSNDRSSKLFLLFAFPLLLLLVVELINKRNIFYEIFWLVSSPIQFLINYILLLLVFLLFSSITNSLKWGASLSSLFFVLLVLVSSYKENMLGEPLFPWDFMFVKLVFNLLPYLYKSLNLFNIVSLLVAIVALVFLLRNFKDYNLKWFSRLIIIPSSLFILFFISTNPSFSYVLLPKIGVRNMDWVQMENYDKNGFSLAFIMNIKNVLIKKPSGYSPSFVEEALQNVSPEFNQKKETDSLLNPNVIFVMSEAFWDPTLLKNVSFSEDPIPTFRSLLPSSSYGKLLSPSYGGGTSNVEFEVLTGSSMSFLPDGSNPYQQYINKPVPSLANYFAQHGYFTAAIHSYNKWFFRRDAVYPLMGFKKFVASEDFVSPEKKGFYISDKSFSDRIIEEYKTATKPIFFYTISMQNHGPYTPKRYKSYDIKVSCPSLSKKSLSILNEYVQGVHDADKSLSTLINFFKKEKSPTIIVFFGDHLPLLGNDFSVYKEAGYVPSNKSNWSMEQYKNMYSPPVLIWANYNQKKEALNTMGACFLGEKVMSMSGLPLPLYSSFLEDLFEALPGKIKYLKMDSQNNLYNGNNLSPELKSIDQLHWLIQYDILFGKEYSKEALFSVP